MGILEPNSLLYVHELLKSLQKYHEPTYLHSIRVANLAEKIASHVKIPSVTFSLIMFAGFLHDIGKTKIPIELLSKTENFNEEDYLVMEGHAMYGWEMLQTTDLLLAHIVVRHHRYGPRPYPKVLPALPDYLSEQEGLIEGAARIIALADYYDALTTRNNDRNEGQTPFEKRERYLRDNADYAPLIHQLEAAGVLSF